MANGTGTGRTSRTTAGPRPAGAPPSRSAPAAGEGGAEPEAGPRARRSAWAVLGTRRASELVDLFGHIGQLGNISIGEPLQCILVDLHRFEERQRIVFGRERVRRGRQ